jgi:threonine dehydrogenase-like Zn-dependent dehydrogenase
LVPERRKLAQQAGAMMLDFKKEDVYDPIQELTQGRGADASIDAVGTEADTGSQADGMN